MHLFKRAPAVAHRPINLEANTATVSPSCTLAVSLAENSSGFFASGLMDRFPNLPMEEEGRLNNPRLRENLVSRVFCYNRWIDLQAEGLTRGRITQFHARHKFLL